MSVPPIPTKGRARLAEVLRRGGDLLSVDAASSALGVSRSVASKLLSRWREQGWLRHVRRGLYASVPLTSRPDEQVIEDPWTLVPAVFGPAYIGGASAAYHWDLTEQIFRSVFVFTPLPVRRARQTIQDVPFVVRHVPGLRLFGTRPLWRGRVKLQISDPARTIIDMLNDPSTGGGISHVSHCLRAYFRRKDADPALLITYAERIGNGAVFKRLGFLSERNGGPASLVADCAARLTLGIVKLDPGQPSPRILRKWRLRAPAKLEDEA